MADTPQAADTAAQTTTQETSSTAGGFTQEDVNKLVGNTRKEARNAAINDLLQKAGAESLDEVLEGYQGFKTVEQETQTEAERYKAELDKVKTKAQETAQKANQRVINSELRVALSSAGINPERVPTAVKIADTSNLEVNDDGTVNGIEDVVAAVREASPEWFEAAQTPQHRAPDASSRQRVNTQDPQQQHAQFLASILNGN